MRSTLPRAAGTAIAASLALMLWGCSEASVAVKEPPPDGTCVDTTVQRAGEATFYTFADGGGNCLFDPTPADLMVGAMNESDYDSSGICGACALVNGPEGQIRIRIVDRCPECRSGDIDLSRQAFALIADTALGRVPITWHETSCEVTGPIVFHYKAESSQWWTAVQVRNHRYTIASLEALGADGAYHRLARAQYNYFIAPGGLGPGPYAFRITDTRGHAIIEAGIAHHAGGDSAGSGQFPRCAP